MFLESKKVTGDNNFIVPRKYINSYLKWIEYIPKHWNIEQILNKNTLELSKKEIEMLKLVDEENKYRDTIKQYLKSNKKAITISNEIHNFMSKMSIDKYATMKLTQEELCYIDKIISNYSTIEELKLAIFKLEEKEDKTLKEEYILFKLDKKLSNLEIQETNDNIIKDIRDNKQDNLYGYEKSINIRNKF